MELNKARQGVSTPIYSGLKCLFSVIIQVKSQARIPVTNIWQVKSLTVDKDQSTGLLQCHLLVQYYYNYSATGFW